MAVGKIGLQLDAAAKRFRCAREVLLTAGDGANLIMRVRVVGVRVHGTSSRLHRRGRIALQQLRTGFADRLPRLVPGIAQPGVLLAGAATLVHFRERLRGEIRRLWIVTLAFGALHRFIKRSALEELLYRDLLRMGDENGRSRQRQRSDGE
jgi:hypothetical protein